MRHSYLGGRVDRGRGAVLSGVFEHAWRGARRLGGGPVTGAGPVCRDPVAVEYLWRAARAHRFVLGRGRAGSLDRVPHGPRGLLRGGRPPDRIADRARLGSIDPGHRGRGQRSQALAHGAFQTLDHPLDFLVREVVVEGECQRAAG